ncbi:peroxide stress protein YaaA [Aliiroseovarius sp. F47248L]|uniref:peroxide stress protein YaaA n=1 Tax=Aliiroseovarius sp. F47248L TaxID=2926420 RepID=UPI001FF26371|nr:peroxide stress protein YaaA [Aliiroseovarius sp. F47248L]MCK0140372.1 peroxide stress protein YaaA [Aliiroseovarius sp. F47248L]
MLVVVSPAKRLDEKPAKRTDGTRPVFQDRAEVLAGTARKLSSKDLERLMHISPALGALNVERFTAFGSGTGEKPAIELFAGDTYSGLDAASLDDDELRYAQEHLCILSGLYGLLRPKDQIAPHRLEMGTRMKNQKGKNLYEFWADNIANELNQRAEDTSSDILVNCASVEYFSAVDRDVLGLRVITPQFLEMKSGKPKVVSFFAKKARGSMARFIVQNRVRDAETLKHFDLGGYKYQPDISEGDTLVFLRDET